MRKRILLHCSFFFVIALSLLTGCATTPSPARLQYDQMELDNMAKVVSGYSLPKQADANSGLVYVVRPSGLGGAVRFNVFLDDKEDTSEMGYTRSSQYIYFFVNPGKHAIFSKAEEWAEIHIAVKAGETVFVEQIPAMGLIYARNSLEHLSEVKGKYYIKHASLGTIITDGLGKIKKQEIKQDIAPQPKAEAQYDTDKKLQELSELYKSGVLSEADYNKAKKRITELQKIEELRQSGVLSEDEYNKAKARLTEK